MPLSRALKNVMRSEKSPKGTSKTTNKSVSLDKPTLKSPVTQKYTGPNYPKTPGFGYDTGTK